MGKKLLIGAVFSDLKKTFDMVDVGVLMTKLNAVGINGNELRWFISYFKRRTQCVYVDGHTCKLLGIECGMPQGFILGPLLFTLYLNDLPKTLQDCKIVLYADDTAM